MLEIVFWGIVAIAAFALLGRVWLHIYLRLQMGAHSPKPARMANVIPINSHHGRKSTRQSVG